MLCDCGAGAVMVPPETEEPVCLRCQVFLIAMISLHAAPGLAARAEQEALQLTKRFPDQPIEIFLANARDQLRQNEEFAETRDKLVLKLKKQEEN